MYGKRTRIIFRILLVVYLLVVAWLCFWNFKNPPGMDGTFLGLPKDKVMHFLMFFPFPLISFAAFDRMTSKPWHSVLFVVGVFIIGCVIAAATEIGQSFTTYRSGEVGDFRADILAMSISSIIVLLIDLGKQFRHEK